MGSGRQWGLLGAGLAFSAAIGAFVAWGRVRPVDVPRPARWADPTVICPSMDVDRPALEDAVIWWRDRGHDLRINCQALWGVSIDVEPTLEAFGNTHVWAEDGEVIAAEILIRPSVGSLGIAHELGHALGYQHPPTAPTGHLMHRSRPGWDARGLEGP